MNSFLRSLPALLALAAPVSAGLPASAIVQAFARQGIHLNTAEAEGIRPNVELALQEAAAHGLGNSKVDFAAVEIGSLLGLNVGPGSTTVHSVVAALGSLRGPVPVRPMPPCPPVPPPPPPGPTWDEYFSETVNLTNRPDFLGLLSRRAFHPVKISWEDIGRDAGSVWGDRISDVGIWVRRNEHDPASAELALSVRRDSNFRDKVLMVPAEKIKVHTKTWLGRTVEKSLPERLKELGLESRTRDRNVIVSNQFAIVPVPSRAMTAGRSAPRAAFTFSILPYGSTNLVITDVIEGSSEAVVGPGGHQLLYANDRGRKAPFTASRAEDRQDLLKLERDLKAQGMDVDVQRYYLIQVPLQRGRGISLANQGQPTWNQGWGYGVGAVSSEVMSGAACDQAGPAPAMPSAAAGAPMMKQESKARSAESGLSRVAIGHGDSEGSYFPGAGWQGRRAEEPIRVTVVYFVTPVGRVTERDMAAFSAAFERWDREAIWGGSFVTKGTF